MRVVPDSIDVDNDHLISNAPKADTSKTALRNQYLRDVLYNTKVAQSEIRVINHILNMPISIPIRDAIKLMPSIRKLFTQPIKQDIADALCTPDTYQFSINI
jgi:hypothetical protein